MHDISYPRDLLAASLMVSVTLNPCPLKSDTAKSFFHTDRNSQYRAINAATPIKVIDKPLLGDVVVDFYQPRTALGRKLIELRRAYLLAGGKLMDWNELDNEARQSRGGLVDE